MFRVPTLPAATLYQLQVFMTVARQGSFAHAADALLLSPPTVSGHVKELERVLGLRLIDRQRGRRSIALTAAGEQLLKTCDEMFAVYESGLAQLQALRTGSTARIRLVVSSTFYSYFLPQPLLAFRQAHPETSLYATMGGHQDVIDGVLRGAIDFGVISGPAETPALVSTPLLPYELLLVGPPGHPLAAGPPRPFQLLEHETFVLSAERFSGHRRVLEHFARERGIHLRIEMEFSDVDSLLQAVANGDGLTVLSRPRVAQRLQDGRLAVLQVEGFPVPMAWNLIYAPEPLPLSLAAVRDHLVGWHWSTLAHAWSH